MARKSRKHLNTETVMNPTPRANVGYIRLSVSNKEESNSIENQKSIIKHWAEQHQLSISRFYIDNGFSGTSFERPGFKNMIQDIADGKIGCLIVKDLSRLGREFITTRYYIEEFFPAKKIRFVSVNDRFDTIDGITDQSSPVNSRIRIPLLNVFNEQVPRDIQEKVQFSLDVKAQQGIFIGPRAPFGYQKAEEDHTRIVPDPSAAKIVQTIFDLAAKGTGLTAIVRHLNENSIPTPIQYARAKGLTGNYDDGNGSWNTRSVKYILTNRTYTGMLVQGKEKRAVEGTHEPLVDSQTFDAIQKNLQDKAFNLAPKSQSTENILKGKVVCGCCGGKMQRKRGTNHADWYFFTCNTNNRLGAGRCTGMYVREEDVFSAVYYQLKLYLQDRRSDLAQRRQEMEKLRENLAQQIEFQQVVTENPMLYYEQYVMGEITVDEFRAGQEKIRHATEDRRAIEYKIEKCEQEHRQFSRLCEVRDKQLPLSTLMEEIDRITVDTGRKITVQWKNTEAF